MRSAHVRALIGAMFGVVIGYALAFVVLPSNQIKSGRRYPPTPIAVHVGSVLTALAGGAFGALTVTGCDRGNHTER